MSMLSIALMAEVWPARESTGVILPMLIFGDFFAVILFPGLPVHNVTSCRLLRLRNSCRFASLLLTSCRPSAESPIAHFAGRLDPASILLHRHGHLAIMHVQPQLQRPDQRVVLGSFIRDSLPYWGEIKEKRGQHALLYFLFLFGIGPAENLPDMVISSLHVLRCRILIQFS